MELERLRKAYYALSDKIRLKILKVLLENKKLCVCQLQDLFKISQPNLSFHLKILREAGFVISERNGKWVHYSLNWENPILKENLKFIENLALDKLNLIGCDYNF